MKKIICVFGTRPEAIKMAPMILALQKHPAVEVKICVTAQHRSMLDSVLDLFAIVPDYDLNIMANNQSLTHITTSVLLQLEPILREFKPDWLLVQGDTTTTFAASLAAYYQHIAIGHLEAGLRTYDKYSPWPEEGNRTLTSQLANLHFAPTLVAKENLLKEAISEENIILTGNTVIDALLIIRQKIHDSSVLQQQLKEKFAFLNATKKLILVTGHRRENFGLGFQSICAALKQIADLRQEEVEIVYPVHLNPNVQQPVNALLARHPTIHLIEPQEYLPFLYLLDRSYLVLTDSGGVQEEAPALGKPVLVMRQETERPEGVAAGTAQLIGTDTQVIVSATLALLDNAELYDAMRLAHNPYGDGTAALLTLAALLNH